MKNGWIAVLLVSALSWAAAGAPAKGPKEDKGQGKEKTVRQETPAEKEKAKGPSKSEESPKAVKEQKETAEKGKVRSAGKPEEKPVATDAKGKTAERDLEKEKDKADQMKGRGKDQAQQAAAVQKQLAHEEQKHLRRRARIQRILELAREKGDEKTAARAQALLDKEQGRFDKKHARLRDRSERPEESAMQTEKDKGSPKETKRAPRGRQEAESEEKK